MYVFAVDVIMKSSDSNFVNEYRIPHSCAFWHMHTSIVKKNTFSEEKINKKL